MNVRLRTLSILPAVALLAGTALLSTGQSVRAQSNQYFDTTNGNNLTSGTATWDAGTTAAWANSATPGTAAPVVWVNGNNAFFQTGGVNVANVSGTVLANNLTITASGNTQGTTIGSAGAGSNLQLGGNITTSGGNVNNTFSVLALTLAGTTHTVSAAANTNIFSANIGETAAGNSLIFTGAGSNTLSGTNTFSGGVTIGGTGNTGTLNIGSTTALGAAAGTFTINSGATFNTNGANIVLANNNAQQWNGNFTFAGTNNLTFGSGAITLGASANNFTLTTNGNTLTYGGGVGETTAGSNFTKAGGGNLTLNGNNGFTGAFATTGGTTTFGGTNAYTGATTATNASITVNGTAGSINNSSSYTISNGTLTGDNTAGNADRFRDSSAITLTNAGALSLTGNGAVDTTETVGALTADRGAETVTIASAAGRVTTLAAASLTRTNGATALIRGSSLNQTAGTNVSRFTLADNGASLGTLVGTNTLNNAGTSDATQAVAIVPWLIGDTSVTGTGSNFVTYDTTLGLRVLTAAEDTTLTAASTTAASPVNAVAFNGTVTGTGNLTVNSLLFNTATQTLNGSGGTLTVNSGAVAAVANTEVIGSGFSGLTLGNGEGVITATSGNTLTINTPISVTSNGGLTKGGAGTLNVSNTNLAGVTGALTINAGTLALGTLSSNATIANNIAGNGGALTFTPVGTSTFSGNLSGSTLAIAQATAGTTVVLSGANTYSGATNVTAGALRAQANAGNTTAGVSTALSANSAITLNVGSTLQLRGDADTTFSSGAGNTNGVIGLLVNGVGTVVIDVNQATAAGSNRILSLGNVVYSGSNGFNNLTVLSATGGNGYTLGLGAVNASNITNQSQALAFDANTANIIAASFLGSNINNTNLTFTGASTTTITGNIVNGSGRNVSPIMNQTGTVILNGINSLGGPTFSFNNGTTVLNNSGALNNTPTLGNTTAGSTAAVNLLLGGTNATGTVAGTNGGITVNNNISVRDTTSGQLTIGGQNTSNINTYSGVITLGATTNVGKSVNLVAAAGGTTAFTNTIVKNGTDTTAGITVNNPYTVNGATVTPTGTVQLTAANTFAGPTSVNNGTLNLAVTKALGSTSGITVASGATLSLTASSALNTPGPTTSTTTGSPVSVAGQVNVTLGGGTLLRNGTSVSLGSQSGSAGTVGLGMLTLTAASTLDYGTMGVGTLNFNSIAGLSSTNTLSIIDFTTTHPGAVGTDGTDDRFIVNQDLTSFLSFITINGITPTFEIALGNGEFELSVTPVPEPSTWMAGALCLVALGLPLRRRLAGTFKRQRVG